MAERVVVAMSGGVDSSVAASMMVEAGYEVVGIALKLWSYEGRDEDSLGSCCSPDDLYDARQVAYALNIPFYVSNAQEIFQREVVDRFTNDYLKGLTPNPCVRCNELVKFDRLLHLAEGLGASALVTGHYAGIEEGEGPKGEPLSRLFKGADPKKDQSYFLFNLTQSQLKKIRFPLYGMTKDEVRAYADVRGLPTASKHESMEICFVGNRNYAAFVEGRVDPDKLPPPGPLVHVDGRVLGQHHGIHRYTIGQRKGLGLPGGTGGALYVVDIQGDKVIVGPNDALFSRGARVTGMSWTAGFPPGEPGDPVWNEVSARIRHQGNTVPARLIHQDGDIASFSLLTAHRAISPGQALVLYRGDEVLGGGWIESAWGEEDDANPSPNAESQTEVSAHG